MHLPAQVLVTTGDASPSSPADTPLTDLPSEEVFFKLIELDSATAPTAVTRDALAPERFHNQYAPIPGNSAAAPPKCRRSPSSGPFLSAAAFPGPFPAAVVASSLLQELHFVHLARRLDDGEDGDSGAGPQWWAISNSMDELQVQLPGAQQDGQLVPNYVVGAAAFTCAPGRSTLHPTDGIEPAEVRHPTAVSSYNQVTRRKRGHRNWLLCMGHQRLAGGMIQLCSVCGRRPRSASRLCVAGWPPV